MGLSDSASLLWKMGLLDDGFSQTLNKNVGLVGNFGDKMKLAFNVVAGASLVSYLDKLVDRAGSIQDTAEAFEITTDSLQGLDYAARQAGVSSEKLQGAYSILSGKSAELASGNKEVKKALEALNIDATAFLALPVDRQLEMIAKGYASAEDKGSAFAAVADLIGQKNAPRLNTVLKELAADGLEGVINKAREAGQVMSSETIADMDRFGDKVDELKNRSLNLATTVLGAFFKLGEGIGYAAANIVNVVDGVQTAWDVEEVGAKQAIATVEKLTVVLRGTKATAEEIARAREASARADEAATLAKLEGQQKIEFYEKKIMALHVEQAKFSKDTKEQLKAQVEIKETLVKLNDERKRQADDLKKKAEELTKASRLSFEETLEYLRLEKKGVDNLVGSERARFDLLGLIGWKKREEAEMAVLLDKGLDQLTQRERKRLDHLVKANEETNKEIVAKTKLLDSIKLAEAAEKGVTKEIGNQVTQQYRLNDAIEEMMVKITRVGSGDNTRLSDRQLQEKIGNLQGSLNQDLINDPTGKYGYLSNEIRLDLQRAKDELALRQQFRREVGLYGEDRALQFHSAFDEERLRGYLRDADAATKTATLLTDINQRLANSGIFPLN